MIEVQSIISPKEPVDKRGWRKLPTPPSWVSLGYAAVAFENDSHQVTVISAVEVADGLTADKKVPQYHLSISSYDGRAPLHLAMWVLGQFDLIDAEEDNHVPGGMARHFWRPVADKLSGIECECKDSEPVIVEDKGDYVWRGVTK